MGSSTSRASGSQPFQPPEIDLTNVLNQVGGGGPAETRLMEVGHSFVNSKQRIRSRNSNGATFSDKMSTINCGTASPSSDAELNLEGIIRGLPGPPEGSEHTTLGFQGLLVQESCVTDSSAPAPRNFGSPDRSRRGGRPVAGIPRQGRQT